LWAIFGAAAAPLPGQIFIINDSILQQHLFWPVFLGLLVPIEWPQMIVLLALVVFQFSHQIGLVLLAGGAGAAGLLAIRHPEDRRQLLIKLAIAFALAGIAFWKIVHFPDSYAKREFTWEAAHNAWTWGVEGWPLRGLELMWIAGACLLIARMPGWELSASHRRAIWTVAALCVGCAAAFWAHWAADPHRWTTAANYRRWVVPLTVPFYLMAFVDQWLRADGGPTEEHVSPAVGIGGAVALTFAIVLSLQSIAWVRLTERLKRDVESNSQAIVPWQDIAWTQDTAMFHWGTASYVFVLEGRTPRHLVLDPYSEDSGKQIKAISDGAMPLASFTPVNPAPGPAGWFDFRPLLERASEEIKMQNAKHEIQNAK
jgi:hypothetical protein